MSSININWLINTKKHVIDSGGVDLYYLLETMLSEQKMSFQQFIYDASRGIGCVVSEGLVYVLDQDLDDPSEFDGACFILGDYESSTLSPQKFVELMRVIKDSYITEHPENKETIERSMVRLKERYTWYWRSFTPLCQWDNQLSGLASESDVAVHRKSLIFQLLID
nr:hypothetical protein [Providencia stuartii]